MPADHGESRDPRRLMLGSVPGTPARGRGPAPDGGYSRRPYYHPAAGWGAARSVGHVVEGRGPPHPGTRARVAGTSAGQVRP
jgi:hypothetical protein